ncbi:MAG: amidophosphoribosyltransferase [Candidatus Marinimicrobia bacterium]|nr:amidophosphoribosyltransferase [Candidatus Neomarinimicrobiota bacterium]
MCGIVGIYNHEEAATLSYLGLYALQHRGQEGAGIVSFDGKVSHLQKGKGLVADVFVNREQLMHLSGKTAIGHVRYSTYGSNGNENIQPLAFKSKGSQISIVHNGNLINLDEIGRDLESHGALFQTTSDTEYIIHLFAHSTGDSLEEKFLQVFRRIKGAFSVLILFDNKMIVARDHRGFRPLAIGTLDGSYIFASETCAFDLIGATYERDVKPGEMIVLDGTNVKSYQIAPPEPKHCIFEYVYFSRPDSQIFGEYVDKTRRKLGKILAMEKPAPEAEIVISVPDSSNTIALGYSQRSTARFEIALIRNHYIGRTFIHPTQTMRDFTAKIKFNPVGGVLKDRKIVVVDDSIVRGTTLRKLARMLRSAGAKEIHIRIGSPPVKFPCYYGMDFPSHEELIANQKSITEIKDYLEVDSLEYISPEGLLNAMSLPAENFCTACFTGHYCEKINQEKENSC